MRKILTIILVVCIISCNRKSDTQDPDPIGASTRQLALNAIGDMVIVAAFLDLQTNANLLELYSKFLLAEPTSSFGLIRTQDAWRRAAISWKHSSIYAFSPLDESLLKESLYTSPNTQAIENIINQSQVFIDSSYISTVPSNQKGLLAIEYLIYGPEGSTLTNVLSSFSSKNGPRRLAYLDAIIKNLKHPANSMIYKWSRGGEGYVDSFIKSDGNDKQSSLSILVQRIQQRIAEVKSQRIGVPLGINNNGTPQPNLVEGKYSNESFALIKADLEGVQRTFSTTNAIGPKSVGLDLILDVGKAKHGDELLSISLTKQFSDIYEQMIKIETPLKVALVTKRAEVQRLYDMVDKLERTINEEVVKNLYLKN